VETSASLQFSHNSSAGRIPLSFFESERIGIPVLSAYANRAQLRRLLDVLDTGDVLTVTRLDRLARSTRDLLNTLAAIAAKKAGFKSLGEHMGRYHDIEWAINADRAWRTGGIRARFDPRVHRRRPGAGRGARAENRRTVQN
jgi:hypothetical protein